MPGEGGAEEGEGLASAGRGFEEGVGVALVPGAAEGGDDAAHERELGAVGLVGELNGDAPDPVDVGLGTMVRVWDGARVRVRALERGGEIDRSGHFGWKRSDRTERERERGGRCGVKQRRRDLGMEDARARCWRENGEMFCRALV